MRLEVSPPETPESVIIVPAHLDSGASRSIFDGEIAKAIGLELLAGDDSVYVTTTGVGVDARLHRVRLGHPYLRSRILEVGFSTCRMTPIYWDATSSISFRLAFGSIVCSSTYRRKIESSLETRVVEFSKPRSYPFPSPHLTHLGTSRLGAIVESSSEKQYLVGASGKPELEAGGRTGSSSLGNSDLLFFCAKGYKLPVCGDYEQVRATANEAGRNLRSLSCYEPGDAWEEIPSLFKLPFQGSYNRP